jgi:hypothetical protein
VISRDALSQSHNEASSHYERQHVTPYIYLHEELFKIGSIVGESDFSRFRCTLDTEHDYQVLKLLYEKLLKNKKLFLLSDVMSALLEKESMSINKKPYCSYTIREADITDKKKLQDFYCFLGEKSLSEIITSDVCSLFIIEKFNKQNLTVEMVALALSDKAHEDEKIKVFFVKKESIRSQEQIIKITESYSGKLVSLAI